MSFRIAQRHGASPIASRIPRILPTGRGSSTRPPTWAPPPPRPSLSPITAGQVWLAGPPRSLPRFRETAGNIYLGRPQGFPGHRKPHHVGPAPPPLAAAGSKQTGQG